MRCIVTGGAGFIGSHLVDRLMDAGDEVAVIDDLSTGCDGNLDFAIEPCCVTEPIELEADCLFNLACPASPVAYQADPHRTMMTCVGGAMNVLTWARFTGARVLQASTSEVYGDPEVHPQREDYCGHVNPIGPRACYDEGKRAAEAMFYDAERMYGVDVRVARIFNTYGPRMSLNDGRVVSNFIVQALRGEDITLYGDGMQTRSFCYVDDTVSALVKLMKAKETRPVNIGNPHECTVQELAEKVLWLTKSSSKIVHKPLPHDDPKRRKPDISRAEEVLDWKPAVSLIDGLKETVAYFRKAIA